MNIETIFRKDESKLFYEEIINNQQIQKKISKLLLYSIVGSAIYGFSMGLFHSYIQAISSAIKVFCLFSLTLAICLPTLHFIGLLFGSKMRFTYTFIILLTGIALNSILLAAFAPVSLFFLFSGSKYEFLLIMHVVIFGFCGIASLYSIKRNMLNVSQIVNDKPNSSALLRIWFLIYMFIGTQMSYLLSPFIGRNEVFTLITSEKGDFFSYLFKIIFVP